MKENQHPLTKANGKSNGTTHIPQETSESAWNSRDGTHAQDPVNRSHSNGHATTPRNRSAKGTKYKHAFAVHSQTRPSPLTRESPAPISLRGFKNLAFLVLACSILRLMIENFKKYGIRVTLSASGASHSDIVYGSILYLTVPCHLFVAYGIEIVAAGYAKGAVGRVKKSEEGEREKRLEFERKALKSLWWWIAIGHAVNATCNLLVSSAVVYWCIENPGIGFVHELHAVILWLKVCSYALTNRDLRHAFLKPDLTNQTLPALYATCPYPSNITLRNLCYFWWAPTLIYQPIYPRTPKIRLSFLLKRITETLLACFIIYITAAQYAVPLLENSLPSISHLALLSLTERVLKLSTISLFCWLAGFYALFQSGLNSLAELTTFGDRDFYGEWWNCSDVRSYWTTWNKPVSHFMKRHVYAPLIARGCPPVVAQILTFLFSALLHELLVGIPTHNILGLAFFGMVVQLPLIFLTDVLRRRQGEGWRTLGNLVFWVSFCLVGQPVAALGYYFAWQAKYGQRAGELERPDLRALLKG